MGIHNIEEPQKHDVDGKKTMLQDFTRKVQTQATLTYGVRIRMVVLWGRARDWGIGKGMRHFLGGQ